MNQVDIEGNKIAGSRTTTVNSPAAKGIQIEETEPALRAYHDYASLGTKRNLTKLLEMYRDVPEDAPDQPPTRNQNILRMWYKEHHWKERVLERERRLGVIAEEKMILDYVELKKKRLDVVRRLRSMGEKLLGKFSDRMDELDEISIQSLAYLVPTAIRAIELANKEERVELGEDQDRDKVAIDKVMAAFEGVLPEKVSQMVKENLLRLLAVPGAGVTGGPAPRSTQLGAESDPDFTQHLPS